MKRTIKILLPLSPVLAALLLIGCTEKSSTAPKQKIEQSRTHTRITGVVDEFTSAYLAEKDPIQKENIYTLYLDKIKSILVDSLGRYIDSMTVSVDTIINQDRLVTTRFKTGEISFSYGMKFQENLPPPGDSLYRFMTSLRPGQLVTVDFIQIGGTRLNYPGDSTRPTLTIYAYPSPINNR